MATVSSVLSASLFVNSIGWSKDTSQNGSFNKVIVLGIDGLDPKIMEKLMDGERYHEWHPRLRRAAPRLVTRDDSRAEIEHQGRPVPGVEEWGRYVVQRSGGRVTLLHIGRFRGMPVLLLMAYWRIKSVRLWERFVETL